MKVRITPSEEAADRPKSRKLQVNENRELRARKLGKTYTELGAQFQTGFQFGTVAEREGRKQKTHAPESAWVSESFVRAVTGR